MLTAKNKPVYRLKYGRFADLLWQSKNSNTFLIAHVLTTSEHSEQSARSIIGYEGLVKELVYDGDELLSVHLTGCNAFYMKQNNQRFYQLPNVGDDGPIPYIYFSKSDIRNVAFTIIDLDLTMLDPDKALPDKKNDNETTENSDTPQTTNSLP